MLRQYYRNGPEIHFGADQEQGLDSLLSSMHAVQNLLNVIFHEVLVWYADLV